MIVHSGSKNGKVQVWRESTGGSAASICHALESETTFNSTIPVTLYSCTWLNSDKVGVNNLVKLLLNRPAATGSEKWELLRKGRDRISKLEPQAARILQELQFKLLFLETVN